MREKIRPDDFTALLTGPKLGRRLPGTLSHEEVSRLLAAPGGGDPPALRDRALLELFYSSGLRVSELGGLMLQQIDLEQGFFAGFRQGLEGAGRAYRRPGLRGAGDLSRGRVGRTSLRRKQAANFF